MTYRWIENLLKRTPPISEETNRAKFLEILSLEFSNVSKGPLSIVSKEQPKLYRPIKSIKAFWENFLGSVKFPLILPTFQDSQRSFSIVIRCMTTFEM